MIRFTILGEPASKANSRVLSTIGPSHDKRVILRKGDKALEYERLVLPQIPVAARQRLEGPVCVAIRIHYATERPDLDESLLLDLLQDRWSKDRRTGERVLLQAGVYRNDRQVRERHVYHAIDRANPRAEIVVAPRRAQQTALELAPPALAAPEGFPF